MYLYLNLHNNLNSMLQHVVEQFFAKQKDWKKNRQNMSICVLTIA